MEKLVISVLFSLCLFLPCLLAIDFSIDGEIFGWKGSYSASADIIGPRSGYGWQAGDEVGSTDGAVKRCEAKNGAGNCRIWGKMAYPKCPDGYETDGCCICHKAMAEGKGSGPFING